MATFAARLDPTASAPRSRRTSVLSPYTDMNDGNDANNDCELAVTGMLDSSGLVGTLLSNGIDGGSEPYVIAVRSPSSWEKALIGVVFKPDESSRTIIMSVLCAITTAVTMPTRNKKVVHWIKHRSLFARAMSKGSQATSGDSGC